MNDCLVSVIIPVYEGETYLQTALESVEKQTYTDWEMIVVEDGSERDSEAMCLDFAKRVLPRRVTYSRHARNRGLGATRNTGILKSRGSFIAFLDHDDLWQEDHLEVSIDVLRCQRADLAFSTTLMFDDATGEESGQWGPTCEELTNFPIGLYLRSYVTPSSVVVSREVFSAVGLFDTDPRLHFSEDHDFWLRCAAGGIRFALVPGIHCLYRKRHSSAATSHPLMILERESFVYRKHFAWRSVPLLIRRQRTAFVHGVVARGYLCRDPQRGVFYAFQSFKYQPENLRYWLVFVLSVLFWGWRVAIRCGQKFRESIRATKRAG